MTSKPSPPLKPQPAPKSRQRRADDFVKRSIWAVGSWLVIGAIAYGDWITARGNERIARCVVPWLAVLHVLMLMASRPPAKEVWPGRVNGYTNAAFIGLSAGICYALFTAGWGNGHRRLWCSLAGTYLGMAVERATGVCGNISLRLARSSAS